MKLRLAIWETGPTVYFDEANREEVFDLWGFEPNMRIIVYENEVFLTSNPDGVIMRRSSNQDMKDWPYFVHDSRAEFVARCHVMELEFSPDGSYRLRTTLPPPHELPWPKYHEGAGEFDKHAAVVREIRVRLRSAEKHTGIRRIDVGDGAQKVLTRKERVRLFQEWTI